MKRLLLWGPRIRFVVAGTLGLAILLVAIDAFALPANSNPNNALAQRSLAKLYASTYRPPPTKATVPPKGISVFFIGAGLAAPGVSEPASALAEAGHRLGWKVVAVDGKFAPNTMLNGVNQAVAAGADAIVLHSIDCPTVRSGLIKARKAGIPVITVQSVDCNEGGNTGERLFTAEVSYREGSFLTWNSKYGAAQGTWLAAKAPQGEGKLIEFVETDVLSTKLSAEGFERTYNALCPSCKIVTRIPFVGADYGKLQQKATTALLAHPEANQFYANHDAAVTAGIAAAVVGSHRNIQVMGGPGNVANATLVRNHRGQSAGVGLAVRWEGFAAADAIIRVLNKKPVLSSGIGLQVYDAQHNLPPPGKAFGPPIDFRKAYYKTWGVG
jgi:ribose transport system substrate-binding protein